MADQDDKADGEVKDVTTTTANKSDANGETLKYTLYVTLHTFQSLLIGIIISLLMWRLLNRNTKLLRSY
jgi:hypothetical protein